MSVNASEDGPHHVDKIVGARIRIRRRELGLSQEQLAHHLGLTFQQVQKYERGTNRVSSSKLYETAQLLKVKVGFFFDDLPDTVTGEGGNTLEGVTEALSNADIMDVITWMVALGPQEKRLVRNLAGGLLRMREEGLRSVSATTLAEEPVQALLAAPRAILEPTEVLTASDAPRSAGRAKSPGRLLLEKLAASELETEIKAPSWMFTSPNALNQMIHKVGGIMWAKVTPEKGGYKIRKITEPR